MEPPIPSSGTSGRLMNWQMDMEDDKIREEEPFRVEDAFRRMDEIAEQMSDEDLPLEEGVRLYREAMKLFRETAGKLTEIEREIQILEEEDPGMEE